MQNDYQFHEAQPINYEVTPLVRGEFKKMNQEHVIEFLGTAKQVSGQAGRIDQSITVRFADGALELNKTEVLDLLHQLKKTVTTVENPRITTIFEEVHSIAKSQAKKENSACELHTIPFVGPKFIDDFPKLLKGQKQGVYAVATANERKDTVYVAFAQTNAKPYIYSLVKQGDVYILQGKKPEESYKSIDSFIENRKCTRLTTPLDTAAASFSTAEQTTKLFSSETNYPYFRGMTYDSALSLLNTSKPGTYLICDRIKDAGGKVVLYKTEHGEIRAKVLLLSAGELQGYTCDNAFYPSFEDFLYEDRLSESGRKFLHPFKKSAEQILAERATAKLHTVSDQQPVTPTWKHDTFSQYRTALEKNPAGINALAQKACLEGEFAVMKWLVCTHKAELPSTAGLTIEQKHQVQWVQAALAMPTPTADDAFLRYAALEVGYGYKTANLMVQDVHAETINKELKVSQVEVPAKLPFSDFEMKQHLAPILGELEADWNKFLATFDKSTIANISKAGFDPITTPVQISPEGQIILDSMQEKISLHFHKTPFHTPELEDWIKTNPSEFYIVRSTGREDTRDNPNPGGNETIPNVKANPLAMSQAIGNVLKSYCGIKSVTQRLMVGDAGLFTEPLFLPVLIMRQVSEHANAQGSTPENIPRSGVLLTRQEGKAEGVTLMQVGLGNCSGIVESKVAVDTYYVDSQLAVREIVREKNDRYVPTQASENSPVLLLPVKTDNEKLSKQPALKEPVIQDMKRVADYFSKAYGTSGSRADMDMEFTVTYDEAGKPKINLLQIRPLVEKQALEPSYLSSEQLNTIPAANKVKVQTLLGGRSGVETLTNSSEAMFVDNLPQALSRYLKTVSGSFATGPSEQAEKRPPPPKVIFTRQASHLTSHEAIFFRNRGVVICVVEDRATLDEVKSIMAKASEAYPVKVCSQRGVILDTHGCKEKELVVKGFASYPIPLEVSVPPNPMLERTTNLTSLELRTRIMNINNRFNVLQAGLLADGEPIRGVSISGLLDLAATASDPLVAKRAIATVLQIMNQQLISTTTGNNQVGPTLRLELLHVFSTALKMIESGLVQALNDAPSPQAHMNKLYHLKFLEGLIGQQKQEGVVGCTSWSQLLRSSRREALATGLDGNVPTNERATILKTIAPLGINADVRHKWNTFINELADLDDPKHLGQVANIMADVTRLGVTSMWMNMIFYDTISSCESALDALNQFNEMNHESAPVLAWAKNGFEKLSGARSQIEEWANPEFTARNIQTLRNTYTTDLQMIQQGQKPEFVTRLESSNKLGKLVLLELFRQAIDVYDKTIKAVTGSSDYPENNQLKVQHFTELLVGYIRMLEGAYQAFTPKEEEDLIKHKWDNDPLTFGTIIDHLEHGFDYENQTTPGLVGLLSQVTDSSTNFDEQLLVRPNFTAIPFIPGQHVDLLYGVAWPKTAEETFTTTHQILEGVRRQLVAKTGEVDHLLEGRLEKLTQHITQTIGEKVSYFNMEGSNLELAFQIPLRQHSCSIKMQMDVAHPEKGIILKGESYGANEHNRWEQTATYGAFYGCVNGRGQPAGAIPSINYDNPSGISFTIELPGDKETRLDRLLISKLRHVFSEVSMSHDIDANTVVAEIDASVNGDWTDESVNSRFFSQCPYIGLTLMNNFEGKKQPEFLLKAAAGALESLIAYGLDDYVVNEANGSKLPDTFKSDPRFAMVPGIQENDGKSLKIAATCYLLKMMDEHPELAKPVIQKLVTNPDLQTRMPATIQLLEKSISQ